MATDLANFVKSLLSPVRDWGAIILDLLHLLQGAWAFFKKYSTEKEVRAVVTELRQADTSEKKSEAARKLSDLIYRS